MVPAPRRKGRLKLGFGLLAALLASTVIAAPDTRYETQGVPTPASVSADQSTAAALTLRLRGEQYQNCSDDFPPIKGHRCVMDEGTAYIAEPTFPWILGDSVATWNHDSLEWLLNSEPITEGTVWLEESHVTMPGRHLKEVLGLVGRSFGCVGISCVTITEVFSSLAPGVRAWAICEVGARRVLVPRFCVPIIAQSQGTTWLRAWMSFSPEGGEGRPDFRAYLLIPADRSIPGVLLALARGLRVPPWSMDVEASSTIILASAGRRPSAVNPAMREAPTVRMDLGQDYVYSTQLNRRIRYVKVTVSTTVYVNDLNTSQNEDWHLPTIEYQNQYVSALHFLVQRTLGEVCPSIQWLDGQRAVCAFPESSFGALLSLPLP